MQVQVVGDSASATRWSTTRAAGAAREPSGSCEAAPDLAASTGGISFNEPGETQRDVQLRVVEDSAFATR